MSASNGGGTDSTESSSQRTAGRFPAPRPRASAAPSAGSAPTSSNPQVPRPRPRPGGPPTGATQQVRTQPARRPAGRGQAQLVRPTPKAKVRKARLLVSKVDPWSVLKMSFLLSVALGIMTVVCAVTLWIAMDMTGIFDRVNDLLLQILGTEGGEAGIQVQELLSVGQVASFATIIAVVNVLLLTVISMLGSVLYNLSASLVGGIGVTLTDD